MLNMIPNIMHLESKYNNYVHAYNIFKKYYKYRNSNIKIFKYAFCLYMDNNTFIY